MLSAVLDGLTTLIPPSWASAASAQASTADFCAGLGVGLALWVLAQLPTAIIWFYAERVWVRLFHAKAQASVNSYKALARRLSYELKITRDLVDKVVNEIVRLEDDNKTLAARVSQLELEKEQLQEAIELRGLPAGLIQGPSGFHAGGAWADR